MSIIIDEKNCTGCGACAAVCPGALIRMGENGKARLAYPRECWACTACMKSCRHQAMVLYIGADAGGRGGRMTVQTDTEALHWRVLLPSGEERNITVLRDESNRY